MNKDSRSGLKRTQMMDFHPMKTISFSLSDDYQRKMTVRGRKAMLRYGYLDQSRSHLNFEIRDGNVQDIDSRHSLRYMLAQKLREGGVKIINLKRNNVIHIALGGSRRRMLSLAFLLITASAALTTLRISNGA